MSDILEEIQELSNKFSNLFEVDGDGLGNPAVDVPPSQNKIKRDRKTKDGKVEVVSVEDELFPYDGNKREQYRQKILDTINNMIQGTATLEDLLQIVRQKKAPLKEAMELMEDTISYIQKQEQPILKKGRANALRKLSNNSELKNKFKKLGKEDAEMVSAAFNSKKDQEKLEKLGSLRRKAQDVKMKDWQQMGNPRRKTKNEIGAEKTEARRYGETYREDKGYDRVDTDEPIPYHIGDSKGYPHYEEPKSDKQRIKDSIARHEKKNSLKEAMELMEDIRSAIEKKHGKPEYYSGRSPWQVGREPANKSAELTQKANEIKEKEALQAAERELDKDRPDLKDAHPAKKNYKVADYYGQIMARRNGKAPLKEAMEVLEDIYTMIDKKYPEGSRKKSLLKIKAQNNRLRSYHDMDSRKPINGENSIDKAIGAYTKNAKGNAKTDSRRDVVDQEYANLDRKNDPEGKKATQKSIDRHFDKVLYKPLKSQANITRKAVATEKFKRMNSEALEEAIELMEELLLERNKENRDKKEKWELKTNNITKKYKKAIQDYAKQEGDEAKFHRAAAADYDHIYSQQPAKAPDGSPNSVAAYFNDKYQEMLRNKGRNEQNIADEVEPLTKKLKNRKHSFHDRVRGWTESEALEEAMKVLEELIGEGRNLEDVVVRGYNKGKVPLDDLQKLMDKAHEVPSDSSYFHKSKGEKGELRTKHRHMDYERNVLSDGWGKDDNKKIEASIKRKAKNDKSFPVFQALKAYKEGKADLKEALSLTEEIINEVSVKKWKEAAKNSIEGRKEAASDASDRFGEVVYPFRGEVNDPGHKLGNAWDKAEQRADRAEQLAKNLPDSNKSATKLKQAAKKVVDKRDKDNEEAVDKLQGAIDKFKEKPYDERTDKDYSDLAKVQNEWVDKQKKENQARNLMGKPERRPEKNSEGKHKLKEQGFIDRSKEA